jgi:hypothetical protein
MSDWYSQPVTARNTKRGVLGQPERIPNQRKALARDWLIVSAHCRKHWTYEWSEPRGAWRPKHWFDPPVLTVSSRHRTEADARKELERSWRGRDPHIAHRYFIVEKDVFERMKPLWR